MNLHFSTSKKKLLSLQRFQAGMTLIEIMVVMAILALMLGISVGVFGDPAEAKLISLASQLSGTIKYVYNEAAVKGQYYRLVIDFGEQSFAVESSPTSFKITGGAEGLENDLEEKKSEEQAPSKPPSTASGESGEGTPPSPPSTEKPQFSQTVGYLLKPIRISDLIRIKDVYVEHAGKKIEGGKTAIYFFPNGWVEKAVLNLSDEKGEIFYSLETFPMTGKSRIRASYFEYQAEEEK